MYRKVMVGFDGSPCAVRALQEGMVMAEAGAGLLVVTVVPRQLPVQASHHAGRSGAVSPQHKEICVVRARELQAQVRAQLALHDIDAELQLIDMNESPEGDVATALAGAAAAAAVDLIILGTHGRSGFRRFLLGSVAESVSRLAACPALLVRAPDPAAFGCLNPVELYGMWPEAERTHREP